MIDSPDELEMCLDQLSLSKREIIVLPVNDSLDPTVVGGGSHWSLLLFHRASKSFFYLDSVSSASNNRSNALKYAANLEPVLHMPQDTKVSFVDVSSSTQSNGSDCGLFTISNAEHACRFILQQGIAASTDASALGKAVSGISSSSIKDLRKQLHQLVIETAKAKSRALAN